MNNFYDTMAILYVDYYNKNGEDKTHEFVLKTGVALSVLNALYERFIKDGIEPIEKISKELKEKFYKVACKYYQDLPEQLKATKAIYTLSLLTASE